VKDFSVTANRQRSSFRHAIRITLGHVGDGGIRTDRHRGRSEIYSYSYLRQSRREEVGALDFPASLVEFQRQFSDDDACAAIASS
jgi:hypothetical protein